MFQTSGTAFLPGATPGLLLLLGIWPIVSCCTTSKSNILADNAFMRSSDADAFSFSVVSTSASLASSPATSSFCICPETCPFSICAILASSFCKSSDVTSAQPHNPAWPRPRAWPCAACSVWAVPARKRWWGRRAGREGRSIACGGRLLYTADAQTSITSGTRTAPRDARCRSTACAGPSARAR